MFDSFPHNAPRGELPGAPSLPNAICLCSVQPHNKTALHWRGLQPGTAIIGTQLRP